MAAAAVSLVLTGCIAVRVPVRVGGIEIIYTANAEVHVRDGLKSARQKLVTAASRLRHSECDMGECVSARDVARALASVRDGLRKAFPEEAAPLLDAVEKQLAVEAETLGAPTPMTGIQPVKSSDRQLGYDIRLVSAAFSRMAAAIDRFLSINDLALTLNVATNPADADFIIQIPANDRTRRSITTNSTMPNVWRGVYTATVKKRGFKDVVTEVDLISGGPTEVTCTLRPQNASEDSVCHVR